MSYSFEVEIEPRPMTDPNVYGSEMYRGEVRLGPARVFWCMTPNPGGPMAKEEMCEDVMRQFAKRLAAALELTREQ